MAYPRFERSTSGFLPTPRARDANGLNQRCNQECLEGAVRFGMPLMLPTPNTMDMLPARTGAARDRILHRGRTNGMACEQTGNVRESVMMMTPDGYGRYGRFTPAIRVWERTLGRMAPSPTCITRVLRQWVRQLPTEGLTPGWLLRHALTPNRPKGKQWVTAPMRERVMAIWRQSGDVSALLPLNVWQAVRADRVGEDTVLDADILPQPCVLQAWERLSGRALPASLTYLSPVFVEWMMGLPAGWVTDPEHWRGVEGNHRNMMIRMLGNGVVPRQAAAAIDWCLGLREHLSQ